MRILTGNKWRSGFLDYFRNKKEYRIQVLAWKNLEKLENVYHTRAKSLRLLINYFPVVGLEGLITKTWSRIREERRNDKYIACGIGKILEQPEGGSHAPGTIVAFIAPWHPALVERLVLPENLVFPTNPKASPLPEGKGILHVSLGTQKPKAAWWKKIKAWSVYSGIIIPEELQKELEGGLAREIAETDWTHGQTIATPEPAAISTTKGETPRLGNKTKIGILYGYGNYAKINIIPYSRPHVEIKTVHEIDPTQIFVENRIERWESSPFPTKDEKYDVYYVASYNHTHVPITLHALKQGAYVVVEKPVVMDADELVQIEQALRAAGRKLFIGFHKRYGLFNKMAIKDLGVQYGEPISYHSIVYELIQPEFFWYNWPVSRSTFLSNGCHQIDHFFHLNNWSKPKNFDIKLLQDGAVEVWIELDNGATMTTTFSEKGSLRVGPRDHVELKVHGRNVRIEDQVRYMSEDNHRIIRKLRIFKTNSYKDMYQTIGGRIANNEEGDSIESVLITSKIMLDLEEKLEKMKGWGDRYKNAKNEFSKYF